MFLYYYTFAEEHVNLQKRWYYITAEEKNAATVMLLYITS